MVCKSLPLGHRRVELTRQSEDGERTVEQAGVKEEWALFAHPAKA